MIYKKLILDYFKNNKLILFSYFISILLTYPFEVILLPKLYSKIINEIKNGKISNNLKNINILNSIKKQDFIGLVLTLFIFLTLFAIVDRVKNYIHSIMYPKYKMWLREQIFSKTLENKSDNFTEMKVGQEIMKLEDIIFTIKELFGYFIINFIPLIVISISLIAYLLMIDRKIGTIMTIEILLIIILTLLCYNKIESLTLKRVKSYFEITNNIDNSYSNISNILINNNNNFEVKKNNKFSKNYSEINIKSDIFLNNLSFIIRITLIITFVIIIIYSFYKNQKNEIDSLKFTTILLVMMYFFNFLIKQSWYFTANLDRVAQMKYHQKYLKQILMENDNKNKKKNVIKNGKIEFKNISFKYKINVDTNTNNQINKIILNNFNLVIKENEKIGIMGKSGSGKSTLMKLLIKFNKLDKGQILIDNTDINNIDTEYLRSNITYINQNTHLFDESIYYNMKYGSKKSKSISPSLSYTPSPSHSHSPTLVQQLNVSKEDKEEIDNLLKKYDLYSIYNKLPNNLDTKAGPRGTNLSLGMQKVSIILRGILKPSKIIIFDEPLAGLDQKTRIKIIELIKNETKNKTLIVITHDKEIIPHMDRIIDINNINNK